MSLHMNYAVSIIRLVYSFTSESIRATMSRSMSVGAERLYTQWTWHSMNVTHTTILYMGTVCKHPSPHLLSTMLSMYYIVSLAHV